MKEVFDVYLSAKLQSKSSSLQTIIYHSVMIEKYS